MLWRSRSRISAAILGRFLYLVTLISFVIYASYTVSTWVHIEIASPCTVSVQELYQNGRLNFNPRHVCNCTFRVNPIFPQNEKSKTLFVSSCSDEATLLGEFQKVVSYSLYKTLNHTIAFDNKYFFGAPANVDGVKKYYPGWVMRIYSNIPLEPNKEMCGLICSDPIVYYCDTRHIPRLGNVKRIDPMRWRFLPIGDPTVEKFIVRDLDSRISQREMDAVSEWQTSNYSFHGMRDHNAHRSHIMGGMWGGDNYKIGWKSARHLQKAFINTREDGNDQRILSSLIYNHHKENFLMHDSYLCEIYNDSHPFPSRRKNHAIFIGKSYTRNASNDIYVGTCPNKCRPPDHQNWDLC